METNPKISTASDTLCELCKCGVGLDINKKEKENRNSIKKQKYTIVEKHQLLEGRMNVEKECIDTQKL
jgi:hypothetical protein